MAEYKYRALDTMAVLLASSSDLDDLIPTLVAYQIEWNKMRVLLRQAEVPEDPEPAELAEALGGAEDDWNQLSEEWGDEFAKLDERVKATQVEAQAAKAFVNEAAAGSDIG